MGELERRLFEEALSEVRGGGVQPGSRELAPPLRPLPTQTQLPSFVAPVRPVTMRPLATTGAPPVAQAAGVQPERPGRNPLRDALSAAGWLLDVGNKFVTRPALGWYVKQISADPRVREAESYTEAWNIAMEGHPWIKLASEIIFDPLNLVGVGLVGKLGKVPKVARLLEASPALAKVFDVAAATDELLGRVQALPVTVPLAGLRRGARVLERITGKPLFQKSAAAQLRESVQRFRRALEEAERRGISQPLQPEGELVRLAREEWAERLVGQPREQVRDVIRRVDSVSLTRAWDALSREAPLRPEARAPLIEVKRELLERGLLQEVREGNRITVRPSERMRVHLELDDVLLTREFPAPARETLHRLLDSIAVATYAQNPGKFADLDDVYGMMRIRPSFEDEAGNVARLFQTVEEVTRKMLEDPRYVPEGPDEELIASALQHLSHPPDAVERWFRRLQAGSEAMGEKVAKEAGAWYRNAGAWFSRLFPRGQGLPEEAIQRLVDPTNVDPAYRRAIYLSEAEAKRLNEVLKEMGYRFRPTEAIPEAVFREAVERMGQLPYRPPRQRSVSRLTGVTKFVIPEQPVNPLLDTARTLGITRADRVDPTLAQRLGIDLGKVDEAGYLVPEEAAKLVRYLLENRDVRDFALAAWAAGGKGANPLLNLRAVAGWLQQLSEGRHPEGMLLAGFDEFRRFLLLGFPGLLPDSAFADVTDFAEPLWRRAPDLARLIPKPGQPSPYLDKLMNYAWVVDRYADIFDEAVARRMAGAPEEEVLDFIKRAEREIEAAALDRWIRRDIALLSGIPYEEAVAQAEKAASPIRAVAERVLLRELWRRVQRDPELSKLYPNLAALQAGLWQIIRIEGEGVRRGLGEVVRALLEGNRSAIQKILSNWDLWMPSDIAQRDPQIRELLSRVAERGILRSDDAATIIDALYPRLYQGLRRVRGYLELGPDGPVIYLTPRADITTLPHELAHLMRYVARGAGILAEEAAPGEEAFARGFERLLATGEAPEPLRQALERYRRIAEVAYRRGLPRESLTPEVARELLRDLALPAAPVPKQLRELLESGDYVILTSDKAGLPEEELVRRRQELLEDLRSRGYQPIPVRGRYSEEGIVEESFLVPGMRERDALELGAKYDQESVLIGGKGLVYTSGPHRGHVVQATGEVSIQGPERLFFTEVATPEGVVKFSVRLDDGTWPRDFTVEPGTMVPAVPEDLRSAEEEALEAVRRAQSQREPEQQSRDLWEEVRPRSEEEIRDTLREIRKTKRLSYQDGDPNPSVGGRPLFDAQGKGPLDFNPRLKGALFDKAVRYILSGNDWAPGVEAILGRVGSDGRLRSLSQRELGHLEWMLQKAGVLGPDAGLVVKVRFGDQIAQEVAEEVTGEAARLIRGKPGPTLRPLVVEDLREVLFQIAAEERLSEQNLDQLAELLGKTFGNENEPLAAASLWLPHLRPRVVKALQARTPEELRRQAAALLREVGDTWAAFGVRFPVAQRLVDRLLPRTRQLRGNVQGQLARSWYGSVLPDEMVRILREAGALERVRNLEKSFQEARQVLLEVGQRIKEREPLAPDLGAPGATIRDVVAARGFADAYQRRVIDNFLQMIGLDPDQVAEEALGRTVKEARREALVEAYAAEMAKRLGVERDPVAVRALNRIAQSLPLRAWREQALLTPRYHLQNILDSTVKATLHGVNPVIGRSAFTLADRLGIPIPESVLWRPQTTIWEEFASPQAETALGALLSRVSRRLGAGAGKLVQFNRRIGQAVESSFRSGAWISETLRQLREARPAFDALVRQVLGAKRGNRLIRMLDETERGVVFSVQELQEAVRRVGGSPEQAAEIAAAWSRVQVAASSRGEELARRLFFDYGDEKNIERWLGVRAWAPFHFWATRNIPFYLETLGQHPWLLRAWESYHQIAEDERERLGLPGRFSDTMPVPLLGWLFGPGTAYANPIVALSIADQLKYRYVPDDAPLLARLQVQASRFGLGLAPWAEIPLGLAGLMGEDWEPMRVLRHSGLVAQATGLDVEQPLREGFRRIRGQPATLTGSGYTDYLVKKRILELSVEETGRAADPAYLEALDDPTHPIFQRAWQDVRRQLLAQELVGMTLPVPVKFLPATERRIREARAGLAPEGELPRGTMSQLAEQGWIGAAYTPLSWKPGPEKLVSKVQALLLLSPGMQEQVIQQDPELRRYFEWARRQPPGVARTPEAYWYATQR
jgi:hypothetical protein